MMDGGGDAYANDNDVGEEDMDVEPQRDQEQPELGELFRVIYKTRRRILGPFVLKLIFFKRFSTKDWTV